MIRKRLRTSHPHPQCSRKVNQIQWRKTPSGTNTDASDCVPLRFCGCEHRGMSRYDARNSAGLPIQSSRTLRFQQAEIKQRADAFRVCCQPGWIGTHRVIRGIIAQLTPFVTIHTGCLFSSEDNGFPILSTALLTHLHVVRNRNLLFNCMFEVSFLIK